MTQVRCQVGDVLPIRRYPPAKFIRILKKCFYGNYRWLFLGVKGSNPGKEEECYNNDCVWMNV
jgi:hypothetical protein